MGAQDEDQVRKWAADINEAVGVCNGRPRTLLAFLNPYGGSGRAPAVWEGDASPILTKAGTHLLVSALTCETAKLIPLVEKNSRHEDTSERQDERHGCLASEHAITIH
jgi:hypothetical protein